MGFALCAALDLVLLRLGITAQFGDRGGVQSSVEVTVTTAVEPVSCSLAATGFDGCYARQGGQGRFVADPAVVGPADQ